jgi:hypothetical protein
LRKDGVAPLPPSGGRGRACLLKRQGRGLFSQRRGDAEKYICLCKEADACKNFSQRRGDAEKYICLRKESDACKNFSQRRGDADKYICLRKDGVAPLPPSGGRGRACLLKRQGWGLFSQRRGDAEKYICLRKEADACKNFSQRRGDAEKYICLRKNKKWLHTHTTFIIHHSKFIIQNSTYYSLIDFIALLEFGICLFGISSPYICPFTNTHRR